jgi:hypothetical protein
MAANYAQTLKNARMTLIISQSAETALSFGGGIDAQSSYAKLVVFTSAYGLVLATITLQKPSFVMSVGVLTMQGVPLSAIASNSGTAALAQLQDSAGTWWVQGLTVGTSATDIILNSTSITSGQTVTITSATVTAAP